MSKMRRKGKSTVVWGLMALMMLGLGGFGVTNFSGGTAEIGRVGDTKLNADDYARGLRQQLQALSQQAGQQISMAQAQAMGLPNAVLAQLVTAAALEEQANAIGISVGDERVIRAISDVAAFRSPNGGFDRNAYSEILRRQGMTEAQFEADVRMDEVRLMLQRAITGGVAAPGVTVDQTAKWLLETRDLSWRELTAADLPEPVADPEEDTLNAWHQANADRFTAPEIRKLTYIWVTPEMLAAGEEPDEATLRAAYERNIDEYQQPERRMVSRLIMPSQEAAEKGKADIDAGTVPFEKLVLERGLEVDDAYLGEMTREQLGAAGDAVFALEQPGVVGPFETDLGPALYQMNAILDPVDIPFEEARESLRQEAALDQASRDIEARSDEFAEMLDAGMTLEDIAADTPLELGTLDWTAGDFPEDGSIAGYQAFRDQAANVTENDFPQIVRLDDGGLFALRLDEVVPPALKPFDEVRDEVLADWRRSETRRLLLALADEERVQASAAMTPAVPDEDGPAGADADSGGDRDTEEQAQDDQQGRWTAETGLTRDGRIDGLPSEVLASAFAIASPGEIEVADASDRVFLVRLDAVHEADLDQDNGQQVRSGVKARLDQTLQADLFDYYNRAVQLRVGVQLDQNAINAVNTQVQ